MSRIDRMEGGEQRLQKKTATIRKNKKIETLIKKRKHMDKLDFLKKIAQNIILH